MIDHIRVNWHRQLTDIKLEVGKSKGVKMEADKYYGMSVFIHVYVYGPAFKGELKAQFDGLTC